MPRSALRRLAALAVGAAALVAVVAVPAQAKTSSPEKWGAAFCGGLGEWADTITSAGEEIQSTVKPGTSPEAGKAIIVGFIADMGDATGDFYDALKKAGNPDTDNGTKIQKTILKGIKGIEDEVGDMGVLAEALPTTDVTSFEAGVTTLAAGFDTVSAPFDAAMDKVSSLDKKDRLSKTLQKVKECKAIF